ncbi:hypothetical protein ACQP3J_31215, partial [Escherichia coli]
MGEGEKFYGTISCFTVHVFQFSPYCNLVWQIQEIKALYSQSLSLSSLPPSLSLSLFVSFSFLS